jgi:hypothetical protein
MARAARLSPASSLGCRYHDMDSRFSAVGVGLRQTSAIPENATHLLENGPTLAFPLRLVVMAWRFAAQW